MHLTRILRRQQHHNKGQKDKNGWAAMPTTCVPSGSANASTGREPGASEYQTAGAMDLAIEAIELLLQSRYDETENRLGHAQILQLLKLCHRTYFTFDGTIYEQVKGTPMGSPISGFIAEAVLQRLESLVFQHHKPTFWARYVDDTFVVIYRDQLLTFKERLNAVFPDIQFTVPVLTYEMPRSKL
nr:unnamed protein product [Spirometra erinaceieuropaei]